MLTAIGTRHAGIATGKLTRRDRSVPVARDEAVTGSQVMGRMVLVVEDDEGVREVMVTALEDDGWEVETAENGKSALEALLDARPGAIILDLRMPVMDGLTFAERYREYPEPRAPLILISATVTEAAVRATGAVTGLRKPIDLNVLLDTVRAHATEAMADLD
jgi:CheY-like chemotaxis protein